MHRERALATSFWQQGRSRVFSTTLTALIWSVAAACPWVIDHYVFIALVICHCVTDARAGQRIAGHLWLLPIPTWRIVNTAFVYAFLLSFGHCLLITLGLNALGGSWRAFNVSILAGLFATLSFAVSSWVRVDANLDGLDAAIAVGGLVAMGSCGLMDSLRQASGSSPPIYQTALYGLCTVPIYVGLFYGARARRHGRATLVDWFKYVESRGVDIRWRQTKTPKSVSAAVCDLDWRPVRDVTLVLGQLLIAVAFAIGVWADSEGILETLLVGVAISSPAMYFVGGYAIDFDRLHNGGFRWTLPVSDRAIAHGSLRFVGLVTLTFVAIWLVALITLAITSQLRGLDLFAEPSRLANASESQQLSFCVFCVVGGSLVGWTAASMGMVYATLGTLHGCKSGLILIAIPVTTLLVNHYLLPESLHWYSIQTVSTLVGAYMIKCVVPVFAYAKDQEFLTSKEIQTYSGLWLLASLLCSAIVYFYLRAGVGPAILIAGVLALALHGIASAPLAVSIRRHWHG